MNTEILKTWLDFIKWAVGSVAVVIAVKIIDAGFQDREINVREMDHYLKYMTYITNDKQVGELRSIAEFYKTISISKPVRERWEAYYVIVDARYAVAKKQQDAVRDSITLLNLALAKNPQDSGKAARLQVLEAANEYLNVELGADKLNQPAAGNVNSKAASTFEQKGIEAIAMGNLDVASQFFQKSDAAYPAYHNSYELKNLLNNIQPQYDAANNASKKVILDTLSTHILNYYSWQLPENSKETLKQVRLSAR
jgi:tetratricopeptide (TPR) repeat protein